MQVDFNNPVRKIGKTYTSVTGSVASIKNDKLIQYESTLERDFIYLLEFDGTVSQYVEQPLHIEYNKDDFKGIYTPDFYVKYTNHEMPHLIEIKPWESLKKNWYKDNYKYKFAAARSVCEQKGWKFVVLTERYIRTPLMDNSKFLLRFLKHNLNGSHVEIIRKYLEKKGPLSIRELKNGLSSSNKVQAEYLFTIWCMISQDLLSTNLSDSLSMNTIVRL